MVKTAQALLVFSLMPILSGARDVAAADAVRVYAAASLTGAFIEIAKAGVDAGFAPCSCVHAASSALARQIAAGAPADIFISANPSWMDYLAERHLNASAPRLFAGNTLVIISARKSFKFSFDGKRALADALGGEWLAVADPDHVPAGIYAKAGLQSLGHWDGVKGRLARAANVRAALALVVRGEAAAGVVYGSDAASEPRVRTVADFPAASHPEIRYMAALIGKATKSAARRYYAFLASPSVAAILTRHGFLPMP